MNEVALHIDFLLHSNDCIIVPGLGGFVVNTTEVEKNGLWGIDSPTVELLFNSNLTYNDGLLAESLMRTNNISHATAIKLIEAAVKELKDKLIGGEEVVWDNLGLFKKGEGDKVLFVPNKNYVRPQLFGLTNVRFKPAILTPPASNKTGSSSAKSIIKYTTTAVAAAVALLLVVMLSFNNPTQGNHYAEMISKSFIFEHNTADNSVNKNIKAQTPTETVSSSKVTSSEVSDVVNSEATKVEALQAKLLAENYYVIVGVYEVRKVAENILNLLQKNGYENAAMIEKPHRIDVYASSFSSRDEAQTFLRKFRKENPLFKDAWIKER